MEHYDIFISYRRSSFETANLIATKLTMSGYSVFFDLETLRSGKFNEKLLEVIDGCKDFILILPPNALDRCVDEEDWVRREVEYAIQKGKNIIPVMLRGFEWPEESEMPPLMRELPNYNALSATDPNLFLDNIERLKNKFLLSRAGFSWRRYKRLILFALLVVTLIAGYMLYKRYRNITTFSKYSKECSITMLNEFSKMNHNVSVAKNVYERWETFLSDASKYGQKDASNNLKKTIENYRGTLKKPTPIDYTEEAQSSFVRNGVSMADANAFNQLTVMMFDEVNNYFNVMQAMSEGYISDYITDNITAGFQFLEISLQVDYYGLLSFYTSLHPDVYSDLEPFIPYLSMLSATPLRLTKEDYEQMQKTEMEKLERVVDEMGGGLREAQMDYEEQEYRLKLQEQAVSQVAEQKIGSISQKKTDIAKLKAELAEADKKLTDVYIGALEKFKLLPTDEVGIMWGKIMRIALLAETSMIAETKDLQQYNELIKEAKSKGVSTDAILPPYRTITYKQKYDDVDKWLLQYKEYNMATDANVVRYIPAARSYFKKVKSGEQSPKEGVLIMAIEDNLAHPVYEVGDIIVSINGLRVHSDQEYIQYKSVKSDNRVTILRLQNGELVKKDIILSSDCKILVAIANLHEIQ